MQSHLSVVLVLAQLGLVSCSGGGGGRDPADDRTAAPGCIPPAYAPPTTATDLGVAGRMHGTWEIVDSVLLSDPRNRLPDPSATNRSGMIEFRDGLIIEAQDPSAPMIPSTMEFYCNEVANDLTFYAFGVRNLANPVTGAGTTRVGGVYGTTSATTAGAIVVEEFVYPDMPTGPIDILVVLELRLRKVEIAAVVQSGEIEHARTCPSIGEK